MSSLCSLSDFVVKTKQPLAVVPLTLLNLVKLLYQKFFPLWFSIFPKTLLTIQITAIGDILKNSRY